MDARIKSTNSSGGDDHLSTTRRKKKKMWREGIKIHVKRTLFQDIHRIELLFLEKEEKK
jgi:hypothetical protein